jgi:hypothetical protein
MSQLNLSDRKQRYKKKCVHLGRTISYGTGTVPGYPSNLGNQINNGGVGKKRCDKNWKWI